MGKFNIGAWQAEIDRFLVDKTVKYLGTRSPDPLVRWSEVAADPLRACQRCRGAFTPLGIERHRDKCKTERKK